MLLPDQAPSVLRPGVTHRSVHGIVPSDGGTCECSGAGQWGDCSGSVNNCQTNYKICCSKGNYGCGCECIPVNDPCPQD